MPKGVPRMGNAAMYESQNPKLSSAAEELLNAPEAKHLGSVDLNQVTNPPAKMSVWTEADGTQIMVEEPPPPWESDPRGVHHNTDARKFIEAPVNVELRWLNPRLVSQVGMRDWQAVPAEGSQMFKLKPNARGLRAPDNTVRKGGDGGPFLAWMYRSWVESRNRQKADEVYRRTRVSVDKQREVTQRIRSGEFDGGRGYLTVEGDPKHPTHTIGVGQDMKD